MARMLKQGNTDDDRSDNRQSRIDKVCRGRHSVTESVKLPSFA